VKNLAWLTIFHTIQWWFSTVAYFFGPPCRSFRRRRDCKSSTKR